MLLFLWGNMKKILLIFILCFVVLIIYEMFLDRRVKYLYIGNTNYDKYSTIIKQFSNSREYNSYIRDDDYRVMDLINEIRDNLKIENRTIQNLLIKSNVIVISIGVNDLEYKKELNYKYIDEFISDMENLLNLIRKYNKDKIYFLGYYNKNKYYDYVNKTLRNICKENKITYIDIEKPIYKQLY